MAPPSMRDHSPMMDVHPMMLFRMQALFCFCEKARVLGNRHREGGIWMRVYLDLDVIENNGVLDADALSNHHVGTNGDVRANLVNKRRKV